MWVVLPVIAKCWKAKKCWMIILLRSVLIFSLSKSLVFETDFLPIIYFSCLIMLTIWRFQIRVERGWGILMKTLQMFRESLVSKLKTIVWSDQSNTIFYSLNLCLTLSSVDDGDSLKWNSLKFVRNSSFFWNIFCAFLYSSMIFFFSRLDAAEEKMENSSNDNINVDYIKS